MSANAAPGPLRYSSSPIEPADEARRWVLGGLAAMFVLIGIAVLVAVLVPMTWGGMPHMAYYGPSWDWISGIIGLAIGIVILVFVLRVVFWAAAGPWAGPYAANRAYWRHAAHRHPWFGVDPALETARERYARGEIDREQYERIVRDLAPDPTA